LTLRKCMATEKLNISNTLIDVKSLI
jgi:hypothetical protein